MNDYRSVSGGKVVRLREGQRDEPLFGHYDAYQAAAFRFPPYNPDALLTAKGYEELDRQMAHAAVYAPLTILRDAILYKGLSVVPWTPDISQPPPQEAQALADHLTYDLNEIEDAYGNVTDPCEIVRELAYAIHTGFRVAELLWQLREEGPYRGKLGLACVSAKPSQQIGFDVDERTLAVRSFVSYSPAQGYEPGLPIEKALYVRHHPRHNLPYGWAVGRTVYKHTWSLDFIQKFWNLAIEIHGGPNVKATAPQNLRGKVRDAIKELRQCGVLVLPEGTEAELMESSGSRFELFEKAADWHTRQCAYAYLLNTLTAGTDAKSGARSLGEVHQDTQEYGLAALRRMIEGVLNRQLVRRWVRYNYGPDALGFAPQISLGDWDEADAEKWAKAVESLIRSEVLHPDEPYIRERLKAPPMPPELRADMERRRAQAQEAAQPPESAPGNDTTSDQKPEGLRRKLWPFRTRAVA